MPSKGSVHSSRTRTKRVLLMSGCTCNRFRYARPKPAKAAFCTRAGSSNVRPPFTSTRNRSPRFSNVNRRSNFGRRSPGLGGQYCKPNDKQCAEKNRTQPIVVCLTGRQREMDRQPVGVHDRVNLACQTASGPAHMFLIVISDAGSVLVHAHDGRI